MKEKAVFIFIFFSMLTACNQQILVDTFHELPESGWKYTQTVNDSFVVDKPEFYHQVFANLRINGDYNYANIYLKLTITSPDNVAREEIVTIVLADKTGKWLGSGIGDKITYQVPALDKLKFKNKGVYRVKIEQYMRIESLQNVVSAGVKVEQLQEI